ncbi:MAG: hypothetical protein WDO70_08250 [Alphaproteobacteria bacterium]
MRLPTFETLAASFAALSDSREKVGFLEAFATVFAERPGIANSVLLAGIANAATDNNAHVRKVAQKTLNTVFEKRPNLADASLAAYVTKSAITDNDLAVSMAAQQTLGTIIKKRPNLEVAILDVALQAALGEMPDRHHATAESIMAIIIKRNAGLAPGVVKDIRIAIGGEDPSVRKAGLWTARAIVTASPNLAEEFLDSVRCATTDHDTKVRSSAYDILGSMIEKRPDLANADMAATIARAVVSEPVLFARESAQRTLRTIREQRPDIAREEPAAAIPFRPAYPTKLRCIAANDIS